MQIRLSDLEVEILRKLINGEAVSLSSQQRARLELAGMIREGAKGIVVTLRVRPNYHWSSAIIARFADEYEAARAQI